MHLREAEIGVKPKQKRHDNQDKKQLTTDIVIEIYCA